MEVPDGPAGCAFVPSTETALCLIPPRHLWHRVDGLRSLYDKAHGKWPPHINLVYPFVNPERMAEAIHRIGKLDLASIAGDSLAVCLNETGVFSHKHHNTLHIRPSEGKNSYAMKRLRDCIMDALGMDHEEPYHPHMTIGQSDDTLSSSHLFLADKIRLLTPYEWDADNLAVLVRDPERAGTSTGPRSMSLWGSVNLGRSLPVQLPAAGKFYGTDDGDDGITAKAKPQTTYNCVSPTDAWKPYLPSGLTDLPDDKPDRLIVASYNVLAEFEWPPSLERHADTIANILSNRAAADILVLEEVTDQFLSFLLADPEVRRRYPYSTHGPSDSPGVGPLPSLLNVIVLSRFALQWSYLPFHRKHKGAVIATFPSLRNCGSPETGSSRLVVAACHLSQGLVDAAVVAKKTEIQRLLAHLSDDFNGHPWIIAGDFNLATSSYSLDAARQRQDLSPESYRYLRGFDSMLTDMGLQDSWVASRVLSGESSDQISGQRLVCELHEGEQGATFDPLTNELAAKMVGSGLKKRPQRYDRIFVNSHLRLRPCRFNMFGFSLTNHNHGQARGVASDHWGIRCLLERPDSRMLDTSRAVQGNAPQLVRAAPTLGGLEEIKRCLGSRGSLASELDAQRRTQAIKLLERALQCRDYGDLDGNLRKGPRLVLLPVGSFALGVWDPASDIDCLCIGEMSQRTFFSLAKSRLRKLSSAGITLLRKVRANSGTMLELDVTGIKFDLQYCSAASILRQLPNVMNRPSSDPVFALPPSTLSKLKPLRDLWYLQRSVPDMAQYRAAHMLLKQWSKDRGLYGARFGLLGSIHLSVMLVPICKALAPSGGSVTVDDILTSFFHHYARFDWTEHMVFDPFFHGALTYHRSFREPLCLLGWHAPGLNTAANASVPTVKTLATELRRADSLLSQQTMSWDHFLGPASADTKGERSLSQGEADFLQSYKSFVRINVHYWGPSSAIRSKFVGWLESRCVMLLVDLDRKVPLLMVRMWPQRFTEQRIGTGPASGPECHGCYLIGLDWQNDSAGEVRDGDAKMVESALHAALCQFEARLRGDEKYFDNKTCWLSAEVVRGSELGPLQVDRRHVGAAYGGDETSEDELDSEDEDGDEGEDEAGGEEGMQRNDEKRPHRAPAPANAPFPRQQSPGHATVPGKFRTATDVMNRLRWDASLDSSDYIIGYEDRFTGTRERRLELWKTEQTDEEFIPQHRILYFKRRSDNVIVWERRTRTDDVFGSGISK